MPIWTVSVPRTVTMAMMVAIPRWPPSKDGYSSRDDDRVGMAEFLEMAIIKRMTTVIWVMRIFSKLHALN